MADEQPRYEHQEYPMHVHKPGGLFLVVHNDAERDSAVAEGWQLLPSSDNVVWGNKVKPPKGKP